MEINSFIDHTLLKAESPLGDFTQAIRDCNTYKFKSMCINSGLVPLVSHLLYNDPKNTTSLCSTIGFPLGSSFIDAKLVEINQGIRCGVKEFDVVPLLTAVKSSDWDHYEKEISQFRTVTQGLVLKVILEVSILTTEEVKRCCDVCMNLGVDFVKTSTGFSSEKLLHNRQQIMLSSWLIVLEEARRR